MRNHNDKKDREIVIILNARPKEVSKKKLTFEEIVVLAFGVYNPSERIIYKMTYSKGHGGAEGILVPGKVLRVKEGMVINVKNSNKS